MEKLFDFASNQYDDMRQKFHDAFPEDQQNVQHASLMFSMFHAQYILDVMENSEGLTDDYYAQLLGMLTEGTKHYVDSYRELSELPPIDWAYTESLEK